MTERYALTPIYVDTDSHAPDGVSFITEDHRVIVPSIKLGTVIQITHEQPVIYTRNDGQSIGVLGVTGTLDSSTVIRDADVTFCDPENPSETYVEPRNDFWFVLYEGDSIAPAGHPLPAVEQLPVI